MTHKALIRQLQISCLGLDRIDPLCLLVDDVIAALAQTEQEPVAWKLMPRDATDSMLKAMDECSTEGYDERLYAGHAASVYMAAWDVYPDINQKQEPVLQDIEQYRMQMAGICTAAIGYWKEGDGIHSDYDTLALRDVAKLYAKYDELYKAQPVSHAVIAGALFDFMGWLTSRKERLVLSSADEASPAVDAIRDFAKMRGLSLDDAKVQDWNTTPPQRTWVGLTEEEVSKIIGQEIGFNSCWGPEEAFAAAIEAKLKEKNT